MKKIFLFSLFLTLVTTGATMFGKQTQAANPFSIQYPITELGNCASQGECKTYCDASENRDVCMKWAQDNGFAPKPAPSSPREGKKPSDSPDRQMGDEQRLKDEEAFKNAPGGCKGERECDAYCRIEEHLNECLDYSVKYGYTSKEEADKIRAQAAKGGPGGCKSEKECNDFCRTPENAKVCMDFVVAEGKLTQEEADIMIEQMKKGGPGKPKGKGPAEPKVKEDKVLEILKEKAGPGGCKNMEECSKYCMGGEHMDECFKFAEENKIMDPEEMEKAKKMSKLGGPGGCKNEEECDAFCSKEENRDTCMNFAKDNGLLSPEEIQMMEKQMQIMKKLDKPVGPGGCKNKDECNKFCSEPANVEICIDFAREQGGRGMISGDAVKNMMGKTEQGREKTKQVEDFQKFKEGEQNEVPGMMGQSREDNGSFMRDFFEAQDGEQRLGPEQMNIPNAEYRPEMMENEEFRPEINDDKRPFMPGPEGQRPPFNQMPRMDQVPASAKGFGEAMPPEMREKFQEFQQGMQNFQPEQFRPEMQNFGPPPVGGMDVPPPPGPTSFNRFGNAMTALVGIASDLFGL